MSLCEDRPIRCRFQLLHMLVVQVREGVVVVEVVEQGEEVVAEAVERGSALERELEVREVVLVLELAVLC